MWRRLAGSAFALALALALVLIGVTGPAGCSGDASEARDRALPDAIAQIQRPTVLVYLTTTCPISNRYAPTLADLGDRFPDVDFVRVYPSRLDSAEDIAEHTRAFDLPGSARPDPEHALVDAGNATVTPQVAVFVPGSPAPRLVYSGRIDDRAVDFGHFRPRAGTRDLEDLLAALATGSAPDSLTTTQAVGCYIADLR